MTKVEAIKQVLTNNGGVATWNIIYNQITLYYPEAKRQIDWKAGIRGVLYRDLGKNFKMLEEGVIALIDYDENNLTLEKEGGDTSKTIQVRVRIGQEKFRRNLLKYLKFCPVTGVDDKRILFASHIKPWAVSTNEERLNVLNGFIFSPTIDQLFDKGLITFENTKKLIVSPTLSNTNAIRLNLDTSKVYQHLPLESRLKFLDFHRNNIFINE